MNTDRSFSLAQFKTRIDFPLPTLPPFPLEGHEASEQNSPSASLLPKTLSKSLFTSVIRIRLAKGISKIETQLQNRLKA